MLFNYAEETDFVDCDYHKTVEKGHGRVDIRECWIVSDPDYLFYVRNRSDWANLRTLVMVKRERRLGTKIETEVKYYISSLVSSAQHILDAIRGHWGIENRLHWVLDIAFREDESRLRKGNGVVFPQFGGQRVKRNHAADSTVVHRLQGSGSPRTNGDGVDCRTLQYKGTDHCAPRYACDRDSDKRARS